MDPTDSSRNYFNPAYHRGDIILKGAESYEQYVALQSLANEEKMTWIYVHRDCVKQLAKYLHQTIGRGSDWVDGGVIRFGLCHGTRRGMEQKWLREELELLGEVGVQVIGTEIAPTAKYFPNTIEWDFHQVKDEWIEAVDFVYSNSFDHSYDPELCLRQWMKCLRPGGVCIIEWALTQTPESYRAVTCSDFFWASLKKLEDFFKAQKGVRIMSILKSDGPKQIVETGTKYQPIKQERTFYVLARAMEN